MLAYHNNQGIKAKYVARMKSHMEADALTQGVGWDGRRGCAVGCTFETYNHARGPIEIGVPEPLMWLEDSIFEGLPEERSKGFPLAFLEAIHVGADLSMVWPRFALWLLADPHHGVLRYCNDDTRPSVEAVADLYRRWIGGEQPSAEEFKAAETAAWAAARAAARAAAEVAEASEAAEVAEAAEPARAAARAAEAARAAAEAAEAAAEAAEAAEAAKAAAWTARATAEEGFWIAARDELLRLLREATVAEETGL